MTERDADHVLGAARPSRADSRAPGRFHHNVSARRGRIKLSTASANASASFVFEQRSDAASLAATLAFPTAMLSPLFLNMLTSLSMSPIVTISAGETLRYSAR